MKRYLAILALCSTCVVAQTLGNLPRLIQSLTLDASSLRVGNQVVFVNVNAGDVLFGCLSTASNLTVGSQVLSVSDTLGSTWNYSGWIKGSISSNQYGIQAFWAIPSSSGSEAITFSGVSGGAGYVTSVSDFAGLSAVDGSFVSAVDTTTPLSISTSNTTTVNGDMVASCAGTYGAIALRSNSPSEFATNDPGAAQDDIAYQNVGTAGAYTMQWTQQNVSMRFMLGEWSIPFQPVLAIADTLMPDADKVQAYSATLHGVGGTGSYTWTVQTGSLPSGLSLNASTGAITGTVTGAVGNYPITFRVTESGGGTHADSSGLSIKVGAAFGTPALVQSKIGTTASGAFTSPITSGNAIVINLYGYGRHSAPGEGYVMPLGTSGGTVSDSLGTVFTRVLPIGGGDRPSTSFIGCATASGADTVSFVDNQSNGSVIGWSLMELSNTQPVYDRGTRDASVAVTTNPYTLTSPSLTVPIANETLIAGVGTYNAFAGTTLVPVAPLVNIGTTSVVNYFETAYAVSQPSGATTVSNTVGATSQAPGAGILLFGLRPEIAGLPCGGTPVATGSVPHRRQEY